MSKKTIFEQDSMTLNNKGLELLGDVDTFIEGTMKKYIKDGYNPSELRDVIISSILTKGSLIQLLESLE